MGTDLCPNRHKLLSASILKVVPQQVRVVSSALSGALFYRLELGFRRFARSVDRPNNEMATIADLQIAASLRCVVPNASDGSVRSLGVGCL
jgi:hypothetical protein